MEEKMKVIIDFMNSQGYVPMKAKEMAYILGVKKEEYNDFVNLLTELEDEYKIIKNRKSKYRLNDENFIEGIYRKNSKGFGFVKIENEEDEIYISKEDSMHALNGDKVIVKIMHEKEKGKSMEGKIVKIRKHEKDTVVGIFQNNRNFGFVVPDDKSFGTDIFIWV